MSTALKRNGYSNARGTALIVAIAIVLLLASISMVLVTEMTLRSNRVQVDLEDIKAFEAAEAGMDAALFDINSAPVYQPYMSDSTLVWRAAACDGKENSSFLISYPASPNRLVSPTILKPITVHILERYDNNAIPPFLGKRPGCLGTSKWDPATDDLDGNGRPTWRATPMVAKNGSILTYSDGTPRYCEDGLNKGMNHIVPQALGSVAFFTYAVDWFHDNVNNQGDSAVPPSGASKDRRAERNKYTVYSTGIHLGRLKSGVTTSGKVVTIEAMVEALDKDGNPMDPAALEIQIHK